MCTTYINGSIYHHLGTTSEDAREAARVFITERYGAILDREFPKSSTKHVRLARWNNTPMLVLGDQVIQIDEESVAEIASKNTTELHGYLERTLKPKLCGKRQKLLESWSKEDAKWELVPIDAKLATIISDVDWWPEDNDMKK